MLCYAKLGMPFEKANIQLWLLKSTQKAYMDDPIEAAVKGRPKAQGLRVGNWISTLLSPIDSSKVPPPPVKD